jgi:hypothetical protein
VLDDRKGFEPVPGRREVEWHQEGTTGHYKTIGHELSLVRRASEIPHDGGLGD